MTNSPNDHGWNVSDSILHRYLDGDLRDQERMAVRALLASEPEAMSRVADYEHQNVMLQALHPRRVEDTMLPPVGLDLAAAMRRGRLIRNACLAGVACVAILGSGLAGWQAQSLFTPSSPPIFAIFATPPNVGQATPASVETLPTPPAGAAANTPQVSLNPPVAPVQPADRQGWFNGNRGGPGGEHKDTSRLAMHPPNLQAVGYQLVNGRADVTAYGPVMRFAYEPVHGTEGARLALSVAAFGADRQSLATSINPQQTSLFWQSGRLLFALSGNVEAARLVRVAEFVAGDGARPNAAPAPQGAAPAGTAPLHDTPNEGPALNVAPPADGANQAKET